MRKQLVEPASTFELLVEFGRPQIFGEGHGQCLVERVLHPPVISKVLHVLADCGAWLLMKWETFVCSVPSVSVRVRQSSLFVSNPVQRDFSLPVLEQRRTCGILREFDFFL